LLQYPTDAGAAAIADLVTAINLSPEQFTQLILAIVGGLQGGVLLEIVENIGGSDKETRQLAELQNALRALEEFTQRCVVDGGVLTADQRRQVMDLLRCAAEVVMRTGGSLDLVSRYVAAIQEALAGILLPDEAGEEAAASDEAAEERAVEMAVLVQQAIEGAQEEARIQLASIVGDTQGRAPAEDGPDAVGGIDAVGRARRALAQGALLASALVLLNLRDGPVLHGAHWQGGMAVAPSSPATDARAQPKLTRLQSNLEQIEKIIEEFNQRMGAADPSAVGPEGEQGQQKGRPSAAKLHSGSAIAYEMRERRARFLASEFQKRSSGKKGEKPLDDTPSQAKSGLPAGSRSFSWTARGRAASSDSSESSDPTADGEEPQEPTGFKRVSRQKKGSGQ
jgi:hypothetical protein